MASIKEEAISRAKKQAARVNQILANENGGMMLFLSVKLGGVFVVEKYARWWLDTGQLGPELLSELLDRFDVFIDDCVEELKNRKKANQ